MALIRLWLFFPVIITAIAGTLGASIWAYGTGMKAGMKGDAEQVLFYGLIMAALEFCGSLFLLLQARKKRREMEKFSELVRYGGTISVDRLKSFGPMGSQLGVIMKELAEASDRKSARIASLTGLLRAVMDLMERSVIVAGLDGRIMAASRPVLESESFAELRQGESRLSDFIPDADLRVVLEEADRSHSTVEGAGKLSYTPVFSVGGEITHFLIDLGKKGAMDMIASAIQSARTSRMKKSASAKEGGSKTGFFQSLRNRLSRDKKEPKDDTPVDAEESGK